MVAFGSKKVWLTRIHRFPLLLIPFFGMIHLMPLFDEALQLPVKLSILNQGYSFLIILALYLNVFLVEGTITRILGGLLAILSSMCLAISEDPFKGSINDTLALGSCVLILLYCTQNAEFISMELQKCKAMATMGLLGWGLFVVVLYFINPHGQTAHGWGGIVYFYGHRMASTCGFAVLLFWWSIKVESIQWKKCMKWAGAMLCWSLSFWTGARVYAIAILGMLGCIVWEQNRKASSAIVKTIALVGLTILLYFASPLSTKTNNALGETSGVSNPFSVLNPSKVNAISNGRISLIKSAGEAFCKLPLANKIIGSGNGYIYEELKGIHAHNDFLNILLFNGLLGLLIYCSVFFVYWPYTWVKKGSKIIVLIGAMATWLVLALTNGYFLYTANMITLPLALALTLPFDRKMNE